MTNHAFQKSVLKVIGVFILALGFVVLASWLSAKIENPNPQTIDYCWDEYSPHESNKVIRHCKIKELIIIYDQ